MSGEIHRAKFREEVNMELGVYILVVDNGESYENNQQWNAGVFLSVESAFEFLKTSREIPAMCQDATIEFWNVAENKKVKDFWCEKKYNSGLVFQWQRSN
jgi:hypothetical protein